MIKTNTGGPAFPFGSAYAGMTLRDYFAAKAMQSLSLSYHIGPTGTSCRPVADEVANYVYQMADAMLKAREANEM